MNQKGSGSTWCEVQGLIPTGFGLHVMELDVRHEWRRIAAVILRVHDLVDGVKLMQSVLGYSTQSARIETTNAVQLVYAVKLVNSELPHAVKTAQNRLMDAVT